MKRLGQPDLFTKRIRRPPAAAEFAVHCMIADLLRVGIMPGWSWWHTPNGGARSKAEAGKLKRMGVLPGVSDFLLLAPPAGQLCALELKKRGVRPAPEQQAFLGAVRAAGGLSGWCDGFEDAVEILKIWGAVRVTL